MFATRVPLAKPQRRRLAAAAAKPFARLRADHVADYQKLFNRATLTFDDLRAVRSGRQPGDREAGPTDERLKARGRRRPRSAAHRACTSSSAATCSSRAAGRGRWRPTCRASGTTRSPRRGRASSPININIQMNYWPAEITSLSELHEPLFDLIDQREGGWPARREDALRRRRLRAPSQHRSLGRRRADRPGGLRHVADGRAPGSASTCGTTTTSPATSRFCAIAAIPR